MIISLENIDGEKDYYYHIDNISIKTLTYYSCGRIYRSNNRDRIGISFPMETYDYEMSFMENVEINNKVLDCYGLKNIGATCNFKDILEGYLKVVDKTLEV